jgi:hypothetical protein
MGRSIINLFYSEWIRWSLSLFNPDGMPCGNRANLPKSFNWSFSGYFIRLKSLRPSLRLIKVPPINHGISSNKK